MKISFIVAEQPQYMTWVMVALLVVLVVALLVVPMFTNKKRAKQTMDLHNSLRPGDVIKTVGGIIGTIKEIRQVSPNEKEMLIETGDADSKTTMWFDIQALYQVMSRAEAPVPTTPVDTAENNEVAESVNDEQPAVVEEHVVQQEPNKDVIEEAPAAVETPVTETAAVVEEPKAEEAATEEVKPEPTVKKPKAATPAKKKPVASKSGSTKKQ